MRKSLFYVTALLALSLTSCGGHVSSASDAVQDSVRQDSVRRDSLERVWQKPLPDTTYASVEAVQFVVDTFCPAVSGVLDDLRDPYVSEGNVLAFRGNQFRDANYGGRVKGTPTHLDIDWVFETDYDTRKTNMGQWGGGTGWTGQPLLYDSMVVINSLAARVYCVDWNTGKALRESIFITNPVKGTGMLDPQNPHRLFVGQGLKVAAPWGALMLDLKAGEVKHVFPEDPKAWRHWGAYDSSPIRAGQFIFRPSENGTLYKWILQHDSLVLHSAMRYRVKGVAPGMEASMAVYKNYGFTADNNGNILCVNLNSLRPVWYYDNHDDTDASLVIALENDTPYIYTGCEVDKQGRTGFCYLTKLNALNGEKVWEQQIPCRTVPRGEKKTEGGLFSTPLLGRGNCEELLFVPCITNQPANQGEFMAFNRKTGEQVYQLHLDTDPWMSPVGFLNEKDEQFVVAGDRGGRLYLIEGKTGRLIERKQVGDNFESSPAVRENHLVVGSRGTKIYRISVL